MRDLSWIRRTQVCEVAFDDEMLEGPCSSSFIESPFGVEIPLDGLERLEELASMGGKPVASCPTVILLFDEAAFGKESDGLLGPVDGEVGAVGDAGDSAHPLSANGIEDVGVDIIVCPPLHGAPFYRYQKGGAGSFSIFSGVEAKVTSRSALRDSVYFTSPLILQPDSMSILAAYMFRARQSLISVTDSA